MVFSSFFIFCLFLQLDVAIDYGTGVAKLQMRDCVKAKLAFFFATQARKKDQTQKNRRVHAML